MDLDPEKMFANDLCVPVRTRVIKIDPSHVENQIEDFSFAVSLIQSGEVVAFPTETVYGLGANALDENAVKKIYITKKRPGDNPLIVHISSLEMLPSLTSNVSDLAMSLMKQFWPGPLTLLLPKNPTVPDQVTCGQPTVGVRMPSHPIAQKLIELSKVPIAAPSANLSGRPSPTSAEHVITDLDGRCPCIIDGGSSNVGVESTVLDLERRKILRPGGVTLEQLREFIPDIQYYHKETDKEDLSIAPPTPGLKYRHYSPKAQVILFEAADVHLMRTKILDFLTDDLQEQKMGLIRTHPKGITYPQQTIERFEAIITLGDESTPTDVARGLFGALREFDTKGISLILMEGIDERDEGMAVMNRIRKAASRIIK